MDVAQQFKTGATFLKRVSIVKHSSIVFGIKLVVKRVENLPLTVERIFSPGAATCTVFFPKHEKDERLFLIL